MPSYDVKSGDRSVLKLKINSTQTTNIIAAPMNINGTMTAWANTGGGVCELLEESDGTIKREWFYYTGGSTGSDNSFTFSGVVRGIARDSTDVTSGGTGVAFSRGAQVRFVTFHDLLNKKANLDRANTWSAAQTVADTIKWIFGNASNWIRGNGNDLEFHDVNNATVTLSQLTAGAGVDTKARVSNNDTTSGFLNGKLLGGSGITLTEGNDGGDETLSIVAANTVATGHTGLSSITTGAIPIGAGTSNMTLIGPGSANQVPVSNGTTIAMSTTPVTERCLEVIETDSSALSNPTVATNYSVHTYTIPSGALVENVVYKFSATGVLTTGTNTTFNITIKLGSTTFTSIASGTIGTGLSNIPFTIDGKFYGTTTAGASSAVRMRAVLTVANNTSVVLSVPAYESANVATNADAAIVFAAHFGSTNAGNSTTMKLSDFEKMSPSVFAQ